MRFSRTRYAVQSALVRGREQPAAPLFAVMPSKYPAENVQVAAYSESCKNPKDLKFHRVATRSQELRSRVKPVCNASFTSFTGESLFRPGRDEPDVGVQGLRLFRFSDDTRPNLNPINP